MKRKDGFQAEKLLVLPKGLVDELINHPVTRMLYVTDIGFFPHAKDHYRERTNGCDSHILIFCINGEGWFQAGGTERRRIGKFDLLILPPHISHSYAASKDNPWSIYWFHFQGELAHHYTQMLPLAGSKMQVSTHDAVRIIDLFNPCFEILSKKSYTLSHCQYANLHLLQILGILAMQIAAESDSPSSSYVENSIEHMRRKIEGHITLSELAEQANLSRSHYLAVFKRVTGTSPMQYYVNLKIRQACTYLDLTDWSIKEISGKLGFQDALYFSRAFSKLMEMSPSAYREKKKG